MPGKPSVLHRFLLVSIALSISASSFGLEKVYMLHGWSDNSDVFTNLRTQMIADGGWTAAEIKLGDYGLLASNASTVPIETVAFEKAKELDAWLGAGEKVSIVCHSMGGLVTRTILAGRDADGDPQSLTFGQSYGFDKSKIHRVVTLATPHYGQKWTTDPFGVGNETQREQMYHGGYFLWDLASDWLDPAKRLAESDFLCVVAQPGAHTVTTNPLVGDDDDGIVPYWSAALAGCPVRYVQRSHSQEIEEAVALDPLQDPGICECASPNDPVYQLVKTFILTGTVLDPPAFGISPPATPAGTLLVRVYTAAGEPVEYAGDVVASLAPTETFNRRRGDGEFADAPGLEQLIRLKAGVYSVTTHPSKTGAHAPATAEGVTIQGGRATLLRITLPGGGKPASTHWALY